MYLCIAATSRTEHQLFLFQNNFQKEYRGEEPSLLEAVDFFLQKENISKESLQGIAVVVAEGTFSSVRIAVTLVNSWHFAFGIPVMGISSKEFLNVNDIIEKFSSRKGRAYVLPEYNGEPNIGKKE